MALPAQAQAEGLKETWLPAMRFALGVSFTKPRAGYAHTHVRDAALPLPLSLFGVSCISVFLPKFCSDPSKHCSCSPLEGRSSDHSEGGDEAAYACNSAWLAP